MATKKVTQGTLAPKKRAEMPVSDGIRRAAKRAGIEPQTDPDVAGMGPAEWEKAMAHAITEGGPIHGELILLAQRFDSSGSGVGHGVATSLIVLGLAARKARTCIEVQHMASRWIADLADVVASGRLGELGAVLKGAVQ